MGRVAIKRRGRPEIKAGRTSKPDSLINVSVTCAVARRAATVAINTCEGRRPATHGDVAVTVAGLYARRRVRVGCNVITRRSAVMQNKSLYVCLTFANLQLLLPHYTLLY